MKKIIVSVLALSTLVLAGSAEYVIAKNLDENRFNVVYEPAKGECVEFETLLNQDQFLKRNRYRTFKKYEKVTILSQYNFAAFKDTEACEALKPKLKRVLKNNEKFTNFIDHEKLLEKNLIVNYSKII